jgi:hypothetical protein
MSRVYFIKPIGMDGPIKVGCSFSPDTRRRTLDTWSPFALEIIAEIDGDFDLERRFHALLREWHQRREWFDGTPEVWSVINAVKAGTFDVTTLPEPTNICHNKASSSAAHKASWTPERRMRASYDGRVRWTQIRSRTVCPVYTSLVGDPDMRARIDEYLHDPQRHGEPIEAYRKRTGCLPWFARNLPEYRPTEQTP